MRYLTLFASITRGDLGLLLRRRGEWGLLLLFFMIVLVQAPFALGPDAALLRRLAPGLVWLAVLLMSFLALDRLFLDDARDGTLDLIRLSPLPLPLIVAAKVLAMSLWLLLGLAFVLPIAALMLSMTGADLIALALSLILGLPSLVLLGSVVAATVIAAERGAALLAVLLAPFYIPVLIFAVQAADTASGLGGSALLFEAAILALLIPLAPMLAAAALRQS